MEAASRDRHRERLGIDTRGIERPRTGDRDFGIAGEPLAGHPARSGDDEFARCGHGDPHGCDAPAGPVPPAVGIAPDPERSVLQREAQPFRRLGITIDGDRELRALGDGNVVGSGQRDRFGRRATEVEFSQRHLRRYRRQSCPFGPLHPASAPSATIPISGPMVLKKRSARMTVSRIPVLRH